MILRPIRLRTNLFSAVHLLGAASLLSSAHAATIVQTASVNSGAFDPTTSIGWFPPNVSFVPFDPSLGTLTGVTVSASWSATEQLVVENSSTSDPGMANIIYTAEVDIYMPDNVTELRGLAPPLAAINQTIPESDGFFYNPPQVSGADVPAPSGGNYVVPPITDFTLYIASPSVTSVDFGPQSGGAVTGTLSGGNTFETTPGAAGVTITLTYTYTPSSAPPPNTGPFVTYTQGGWGTAPHGNNPGAILKANWTKVFGTGGITIGNSAGNCLFFNSAAATEAFLPQGGPDTVLPNKGKQTDPTGKASNITGQLLSVELSVAFSDASIFGSGLGDLTIQSGPLKGYTVIDAVDAANALLGGTAYPAGVPVLSLSNLDAVLTNITSAYDNGTSNTGYIK